MDYFSLGEIRSIGDEWGLDRIVPYQDGQTLYAITFEGVDGRIPESPEGMVSLAMMVAEGARKAGYLWNVQAILVSPGEFWRVDVVVDPATSQWVRVTGWETMRVAIEGELKARGVAPAISRLHVLSLTGSDAKQFSLAGGIAPFVVCSDKGCSPTKAATSPHPRQMMRGTVEQASSAIPLSVAQVVAMGVPWWLWPVMVGTAVGIYILAQDSKYRPNESCPHCPGGKVPT